MAKPNMHFGIAERGKLYSLERNYPEALRHFREAIQMSVREKASEVFFQHYTQCVMEVLERSGAHEQVIAWCDKTLEFLDGKSEDEAQSEVIQRNYASLLERKAIQHFYQEQPEIAKELLERAVKLKVSDKQKLTRTLLGWLQRGYRVNATQLYKEQTKHDYFIVRADKVDASYAIDLPKEIVHY